MLERAVTFAVGIADALQGQDPPEPGRLLCAERFGVLQPAFRHGERAVERRRGMGPTLRAGLKLAHLRQGPDEERRQREDHGKRHGENLERRPDAECGEKRAKQLEDGMGHRARKEIAALHRAQIAKRAGDPPGMRFLPAETLDYPQAAQAFAQPCMKFFVPGGQELTEFAGASTHRRQQHERERAEAYPGDRGERGDDQRGKAERAERGYEPHESAA